MRCALLFLASVASAQQTDPRGFVNERLLRQNFARMALKATTPPVIQLLASSAKTCAIPLLEVVPMQKDIDTSMIVMIVPQSGKPVDQMMTIIPTIPVCGKK